MFNLHFRVQINHYLYNLSLLEQFTLSFQNTLKNIYFFLCWQRLRHFAWTIYNFFSTAKVCNYSDGWNTCEIGRFLQRGKILGFNLDPDEPMKTVLAIVVSCLFKKWSYVVRLLPCAPVSAEKLFDTIKSCICDVEDCGLFGEIISTEPHCWLVRCLAVVRKEENYLIYSCTQ